MKVRIDFTIDINPNAWIDEYGTEPSEIRSDVQRHVQNSSVAQLESLGMLW